VCQTTKTAVLYLICCEINRAARLAADRAGVSRRDWLACEAELRQVRAEAGGDSVESAKEEACLSY
jgi:hypothetical protein